MTGKTRNILLAVLGVFAAAAVLAAIFKAAEDKSAQNIAGSAPRSDYACIINGTEITAYDFNGRPYIAAEALRPFGIIAERSEDALNITYNPNALAAENADGAAEPEETAEFCYTDYETRVNGAQVIAYAAGEYTFIQFDALKAFGTVRFENGAYYCDTGVFDVPAAAEQPSGEEMPTVTEPPADARVIVLDPGHGKPSGEMSDGEREMSGWVYNASAGEWGEWRHFKYGTLGPDCGGEGCGGRVTPNGACWYPIYNSDRDGEPEINLNNCLAAKAYLEQMGYTVRLTRESNDENPSITRRLTYCYPDNDVTRGADADIFICVHSNAGGGSGSSYIQLEGPYDQPTSAGSSQQYTDASNTLGKYINDAVCAASGLTDNAPITFEPELIAFCKAPVVCGYLEIGFFDNPSDREILENSSDAIGRAIAEGADRFLREYFTE